MQGLFTLLSLSIVMATASFLAGILPLSMNLSRDKLRLLSTIGMGVLVGTSLIVIIPEGVDTMYSSTQAAHQSSRLGRSLDARSGTVYQANSNFADLSTRSTVPAVHGPYAQEAPDFSELEMPGPVIPDAISSPPKTPTESGMVGILDTDTTQSSDQSHAEKDEAHHAWIGIALITGFVLMFLIDKVPQSASSAKPKPRTHHISLNNLGSRFNISTNLDREEEAESFLETNQTDESRRRSFATTIGLVIHSAADGIALGASSSTGHSSLSFIIFFAIMLHKAPAAFGLTSVLLRQGLSKRMARTHLIMFSLAAPIGAVLTWIAAHLLGAGSSHNAESTTWWTGILLLFSAGTFLYVAMHAMQEITNGDGHGHSASPLANGSIGEGSSAEPRKPSSMTDLAAAVFGMILPLFMQVGHTH